MADERTEKQKVQEITDKLEEGLKELFESEKYKTYLSTMSKFHNYSFNNTLLIAMQKPEATLVAGYKAWQKNFERHVNKGEKAIRILAPAPYKIKEERDKLDPVTGEMMFDENGMPQKEQVEVTIPAFRAVSVFDVSQTDGKPIPELEAQELLSTVEGYEDFVQALMNVAPVPIGFEDIPGDSKGYFHTEEKRIAVQENMSESQTLKTMVHEVAHFMLHNKNNAFISAVYLMTADFDLWQIMKHHTDKNTIDFESPRLKGIGEKGYTLYCVAKDLYLGTKHLSISDLADKELISKKMFALICNAMAIRRFGIKAMELAEEMN